MTQSMITGEGIYTPQEVAQVLKVSAATLSRAIRDGKLKALRVGGQWRIVGTELVKYLNSETQAALDKTASRHETVNIAS
jgi:excisionase family DNA binding protein